MRKPFQRDTRPTSARAYGIPESVEFPHRAVRPAVVSVDVPAAGPVARAQSVSAPVEVPRERRDGEVERPSVQTRPGRVVFSEAPYRRRVRMGIDDR